MLVRACVFRFFPKFSAIEELKTHHHLPFLLTQRYIKSHAATSLYLDQDQGVEGPVVLHALGPESHATYVHTFSGAKSPLNFRRPSFQFAWVVFGVVGE
jgi:hypothetical protein